MEEQNTSLLSPLSPLPPPSLLPIPTTITQDFSFFNDTFFEKSLSGLWLDITKEDALPTKTSIKHSLPSMSLYVVILESSEVVAQSQNPVLSIIPSNPEVVLSNNNITNKRVTGPKCDEPDDEDNIITRLKLRASTMASVANTMSMNNKRNKNNLSKITYLTESESVEDGYKWHKYGKKSLKKSPFPNCNAKKRMERYVDDPTHVLTTYVGLHAHDLPPILPAPSRSFNLYNSSTVSPKFSRGSGVQKPVLSDAGAGARERKHANNIITSVNVRTDSDSCDNDVASIEDIGTRNISLLSPLSPLPPPSLLSIPTTITQDFSFFNDTFFEKPLSGLVNVGDFGPSLYEWLDIVEEDAPPTETPIKHPLPSLSPYVLILESSEVVAQSQNPVETSSINDGIEATIVALQLVAIRRSGTWMIPPMS
ncbi:hypothetical protein Ahy_B02g058781 [Arachis hypogaea]|uniref:WRKY domain-containing protein n=1 Tax=Arachis hypogaea TaxID=3818 RepID=A0A445AFE8_ARAHY|nr:hypothetical protein Ahy_B02g058781 [Arachis hypogaea]